MPHCVGSLGYKGVVCRWLVVNMSAYLWHGRYTESWNYYQATKEKITLAEQFSQFNFFCHRDWVRCDGAAVMVTDQQYTSDIQEEWFLFNYYYDFNSHQRWRGGNNSRERPYYYVDGVQRSHNSRVLSSKRGIIIISPPCARLGARIRVITITRLSIPLNY